MLSPRGGGGRTGKNRGFDKHCRYGVGNLVAKNSPSLGWFEHYILHPSGRVGHLTAISDCDKNCDSRLISKARMTLAPGMPEVIQGNGCNLLSKGHIFDKRAQTKMKRHLKTYDTS